MGFSSIAQLRYAHNGMLSIEDLQDRLGLSEWQTRRLLDAVRPVLERQGLLTVAPGRKAQISPQAVVILERAKNLNRRGIPLSSLADLVQSELEENRKSADAKAESVAQGSANLAQSLILIEELRARVADLKAQIERLDEENRWLRSQLEATLARIPELPPGKALTESSSPHLSRWRALKYALLGR